MRIAVVTRERGNDRRYGMGRSWASVAEAIERRGHELLRIDADALDAEAEAEAHRFSLRLGELGPSLAPAVTAVLANAWAVGTLAARVAAAERVDVVDCHDFLCAAGLNSAGRRLGIALPRWGYHQHSFDAGFCGLDRFYGPLEARLRRALQRVEERTAVRAKWVIFPAASARLKCARDLGVLPPPHWTVLPHPVATPSVPPREQARQQLGCAPQTVLVLGIGQLVALKRFDHLLRAFATLPGECMLGLLGEGDEAGLAELARRLGVADRVRMRAVDDVGPWLAAADVYVSTSATEAFGMANAEAICAGLPCLISATGAAGELFSAHAQLLAPDLSDLGSELHRLARDTAARAALAARTEGFAATLPSVDQAADRLLALFAGQGTGDGSAPGPTATVMTMAGR